MPIQLKPMGIIPPIVTPLTPDGKLNEKVLRQLTDHLIENGCHGIFPLGTTGEFYAFDQQESRRIFQIVVDECAGRIPVYAGANHITTRGVIETCKIAESVGANAVSVLTPMFISQTQDELYDFYATVASHTRLPIIVYNNRPKTNINVDPETVARLARIDNIIGVKDSSGDFTNTAEYIRLTRGNERFSVLLGRDTLIFAGLCHGAAGAIAATANIAPRLVVDIYEKFRAGDLAGSLAAQFQLAPLRMACNMGTFPEVIKEALMMIGFAVGKCLEPIAELAPEQKAKLRRVLLELGLPANAG
jgi:4-hydroxy-tetrahydrodipicolinate synthase